MNWVSSLPSPNFASSGGELGTGGADECDELLDSGEVYRGIAIRAKSSIDPCDNPPGITRRCLLQSRTRLIRIKFLRTSTILQHIQLTYLRELGGLLGGRIWGGHSLSGLCSKENQLCLCSPAMCIFGEKCRSSHVEGGAKLSNGPQSAKARPRMFASKSC